MAGEKQVIYYSTIHLTRREDILVQSIISLYRSKDGFEWIHGELKDATVAIIGTVASSLIKSDQDPFDGVEKEQVVCILGDTFYPKNARAVVHIDLPIKALVFVDQLSDIERSYINKPISMGYVASNFLAKQTLQAQVDSTIAKVSSMQNAQQNTQVVALNKNGMIDFVPRNIKVNVEDSIAANEASEDTKSISISSSQIKKPIASNFLKNEIVKKDSFSFNLEAGLYKDKDLSKEADAPINAIAGMVKEQVSTNSELAVKSIDNVTDVSVVKEPPVLTEAIIDDKTWEALLKGKMIDSELSDKPEVSLSPTTEKIIKDSETELSLTESKVEDETSVSVTITQEKLTIPDSPNISETDQLKRIKLLRWPKSEIIQRHPGNAILASMVINIPMSVSDMAKQSDLPIQICQRFVDAIIESNVAEYVDDIPNSTDASKPENNDASKLENKVEEVKKVEEVSKRKGILYRIRAALGLLRK